MNAKIFSDKSRIQNSSQKNERQKLSREQLKNVIYFIIYRYMLATIFISHLTILGLSYKSIQSYQRKWTRDETWYLLITMFL